METARFQLVRGTYAGDLTPPWPVVGPRPPGTDGEEWFAWRLLSRNHRDLARSPAVYATAAECVDAIAVLRGTGTGAETVLEKNPATGRWTWHLRTPAGAVAAGSRGYLRRRECQDCIAHVLELAPVALEPHDRPLVPPARPSSVRGNLRIRGREA